MEKKPIDLSIKLNFLGLSNGSMIAKFDNNSQEITWAGIVTIEPTLSGNIAKMAIKSPEDTLPFFIHLNDDKKLIFDDDGKVFFDFNQSNESLLCVDKN